MHRQDLLSEVIGLHRQTHRQEQGRDKRGQQGGIKNGHHVGLELQPRLETGL